CGGLGIPTWRLPFEVLARVFNQPMFPDRLALAAAIMLICNIALREFTIYPIRESHQVESLLQLDNGAVRICTPYLWMLDVLARP
ncbi:hypothetical protein, partial [Salmonella sp. SAL4356]|uniref:hypothetical protein n=1 Tax=Salmonella sp. SAL4356 TaxID=3159877 RepID=UPI00397B2DEC